MVEFRLRQNYNSNVLYLPAKTSSINPQELDVMWSNFHFSSHDHSLYCKSLLLKFQESLFLSARQQNKVLFYMQGFETRLI